MAYEPFNAASGNADDTSSDTIEQLGSAAGFLGGSDGSLSGGSGGVVGGDEFDPDIHIGRDKRNADGSYRKKRGRKSSGNPSAPRSRKKEDFSASVDSLARMLGYLHLGIAGATKSPEFRLEDDEAQALAKATARVLEEFDIRPSPKAEAIVGLVTTSVAIYTPKIYFVRDRLMKEREIINQ